MRVGIYTRVSSEEQARSGYSLEEQESACLALAERENLQVVKVYRDPGYSGGSLDRPALKELIRDVKANRLDMVLVWKTDRLSRWLPNIVDLVLNVFQENDVKFRSATEPYDTTSLAGRLLFAQLAAFADFERGMIRERTLMGREGTARKGNWAGGRPPFGYRIVGERGARRLEKDDRAAVVRQIFEAVANGAQQRTIARQLNEQGLTTAEGGYWTASKIRRLVTNPVYKGLPVWRRRRWKSNRTIEELPEAQWVVGEPSPELAIVSEELWEKANRLLGGRSGKRGGWTKGRFLLTGLLRCGLCGSKYEPVTTPGRKPTSPQYEGYRCGRKSHGGSALCSNSLIPRRVVEGIVEQRLLEHIESFRDEGYRKALAEPRAEDVKRLVARMDLVERAIEQNHRATLKWYKAFENESASAMPELVKQRLAELNQERARLDAVRLEVEKELAAAEARAAEVQALSSMSHSFRSVWEDMTTEEKKSLLLRLVESVTIFPDRRVEVSFYTA
ncbi:MAG: recombinase family protein [Betaproteobacteria bacterium]